MQGIPPPFALAAAALLFATGCGRNEAALSADEGAAGPAAALPAPPPDPVDLTRFNAAFAQADPALKLYAEETVAVIRARAFHDAVEQLQTLARLQTLNAEQRQATQEVLSRLATPGGVR